MMPRAVADSTDLLALYRDMEARCEEPVMIYHSHTAGATIPSETDVAYAAEPGAHYVVVSTRAGRRTSPEVRSYRILDRTATEEPVDVVEAGEPT
jgi:proteasome lid subunit RPN8/RPN11